MASCHGCERAWLECQVWHKYIDPPAYAFEAYTLQSLTVRANLPSVYANTYIQNARRFVFFHLRIVYRYFNGRNPQQLSPQGLQQRRRSRDLLRHSSTAWLLRQHKQSILRLRRLCWMYVNRHPFPLRPGRRRCL